MKLTESKLREIIKEEIQKLNEGGGKQSIVELETMKGSITNHILNMRKKEASQLQGVIKYSLKAMKQSDIEKWEKVEYQGVIKDAEFRLAWINKDIKRLS
jgi:hypothetical protein